jgi:hypothetical protein
MTASETHRPFGRQPARRFRWSALLGCVVIVAPYLDLLCDKVGSPTPIERAPVLTTPLPQYLNIDRNFDGANARLHLQLLKRPLSSSSPLVVGCI